jgi:signal transduction histidine kinase
MNLSTYYRTLGSILCSLALLAWFADTSYKSFSRYTQESEKVAKVQGILSEINKLTLASYKVDLEQQYFLITGKKKYMERFLAARADLQKALRDFAANHKPYSLAPELGEVESLLLARIEFGNQLVDTRERQGYLPALQVFFHEKNRIQMAQLDSKLSRASARTEKALFNLSEVSKANMNEALESFTTAGAIALLIIFSATVLIIRDLRYRDRKERELSETKASALRASSFKSLFLANMSHEIRTPLNCIIGMIDILMETPINSEQTSYLKSLQRAGESLLTIINNILDLSKVEAGEMTLESISFDVYQVCSEVIDIMSVQAKEKNLGLILNFDVELKYLTGDPIRIRQILMNLIGNAIKFTETGAVQLYVCFQDQLIRFQVQDSGKGISPDKIKEIFEPFSQEDLSTTRQYGGTGLGLSITRQLVELMKGDIRVESEVGFGSVFSVNLPLPVSSVAVDPSTHTDSNKKILDLPRISDKRERILVVDDTEENRTLIQLYLKQYPIELDFAGDGQQAVDKFKTGSYSLILMDMQMPILDGYSAARLIRSFEKDNARVPSKIVALSASAFKEEIEKSLKAGCDEHISKPIRRLELVAMISRMLSKDLQNSLSKSA